MIKFLGPFENSDSSENLELYTTWVNLDSIITIRKSSVVSSYVYAEQYSGGGRRNLEFEFFGPNPGDNQLPDIDYNYLRFVNANFIYMLESSPTDFFFEPQYPKDFPTRNIYLSL
jgi:hypothetical protein